MTGDRLDDRDSIPSTGRNFHYVQTGSGTYPPSYSKDTIGSFAGDKAAGITNARSFTSTSPYVFMAQCLKDRDNFYLLSRHSPGGKVKVKVQLSLCYN